MKFYLAGITALLLLPAAAAFASPPDSSGTSLLKGVSLKKIKSPFTFMQSSSTVKLQEKEVNDPVGIIQRFMSGLNAGGYYRAYLWGRTLTNDYTNPASIGGALGTHKVLSMGDGNYDPVMLLYVGGAPTVNTSIGSELILLNPYTAYNGPTAPPREFNTYFNMVLRGNTTTKFGNFNVVAGGIQWTQLSPFTFGTNIGYQRYSIWERRPWDPVGNVTTRYASYYYNGTINQDARFGTRAFKGFIVNGYDMPFKTSLDFFYGKTDINGGFDREVIVRPKSNVGGKITKNFKNNNRISLNTFNSFVRTDSINSHINVQWNVFTSEYNFNFKEFNLNGEVGVGGYASPNYKRSWGPGVLVNLITPKKYTGLPFSLRYFQIDKSFTSNVAQFSNTSIQEVTSGFLSKGTQQVLAPFGGNMTGVGDLANNRRGGAINTEVKVWKFKFIGGLQMESEMDLLGNKNIITYSHRINSLTWSRLPQVFPYNNAMGPNGRVKTIYRGAYETVGVFDNPNTGDTTPVSRKHYASLDFQIKFKSKLFDRDIYFYNLNTVMSVQNKFSPVPVFSNKAYINAHYHEGELYYHLVRNLIISFYGGLEYVKGNKYTDTTTAATGVNGITGKARDQIGKAFGVGLDFTLSSNTALYLRQRWFSFNDKYFKDENFKGNEATIEFKIFF
ncbi:MAG TPA: hypothetical protein VNB90_08755 [Cytophagaceae bacterium]|nr:hypothetical protein [Cytophagaceae bacterium]